jgi:hypothetical protein
LQTKISPTSFAIPSQPYCSIRERPSWPCSPFWAMRNRRRRSCTLPSVAPCDNKRISDISGRKIHQ